MLGDRGHKPYNPRTGAVDASPLGAISVPLHDVVDIASGDRITCAVKKSGAVACFGVFDDATRGGLPEDAMGTWIFSAEPPATPRASPVGGDPRCAITRAGTVYCWGHGKVGQLGDGSGGARRSGAAIVLE
ncbi:MAG: hypothetical protein U0414_26615 [Polyangiaceae bacterium]